MILDGFGWFWMVLVVSDGFEWFAVLVVTFPGGVNMNLLLNL